MAARNLQHDSVDVDDEVNMDLDVEVRLVVCRRVSRPLRCWLVCETMPCRRAPQDDSPDVIDLGNRTLSGKSLLSKDYVKVRETGCLVTGRGRGADLTEWASEVVFCVSVLRSVFLLTDPPCPDSSTATACPDDSDYVENVHLLVFCCRPTR